MRLCINKKCSLCSPLFGDFSIAKCCSVVNCFLLFFITFYYLGLILCELCILFAQNGHVAYRRHYHACHEGMAASDFLCYQIFQFLVHCFCKYLMPGSVHMLLVSSTAAYIGGARMNSTCFSSAMRWYTFSRSLDTCTESRENSWSYPSCHTFSPR